MFWCRGVFWGWGLVFLGFGGCFFLVSLPEQHGCSFFSCSVSFLFFLKIFVVCVNSRSKQLTCKVTSQYIDKNRHNRKLH